MSYPYPQYSKQSHPRFMPDYVSATVYPADRRNYDLNDEDPRWQRKPIDTVVLHCMEGPFEAAILRFADSTQDASCHYCVDKRGHVGQCVPEAAVAWHAGVYEYNARSVGIEMAGYISDPNNWTNEMLRESAKLCADICNRHNIPVDRQHIILHSEVPYPNDHVDPGPYFPRLDFMQRVRYWLAWMEKPYGT